MLPFDKGIISNYNESKKHYLWQGKCFCIEYPLEEKEDRKGKIMLLIPETPLNMNASLPKWQEANEYSYSGEQLL